jgi:hypothetical protein
VALCAISALRDRAEIRQNRPAMSRRSSPVFLFLAVLAFILQGPGAWSALECFASEVDLDGDGNIAETEPNGRTKRYVYDEPVHCNA